MDPESLIQKEMSERKINFEMKYIYIYTHIHMYDTNEPIFREG